MNKGELLSCIQELLVGFPEEIRDWLPADGAATCVSLERNLAWLRAFYRFGGVAGSGVDVAAFKSVIPTCYQFVLSFSFSRIDKLPEAKRELLLTPQWVSMALVDGVRGLLVSAGDGSYPVFVGRGYEDGGSLRDYTEVLGFDRMIGPMVKLALDVRLTLGVSLSELSSLGLKGYKTKKEVVRVLLTWSASQVRDLAERVFKVYHVPLFNFALLYPVCVGTDAWKGKKCANQWGYYDTVLRKYEKSFGYPLVAVPRCCGDLTAKQRFKGMVWGLGYGGVVHLNLDACYGDSSSSATWYYEDVVWGESGGFHVLCEVFGCRDFVTRREWVLGYYQQDVAGDWVPHVAGFVTTNVSERPARVFIGQIVEVVCRGCHASGVLIGPVLKRLRFDLGPESAQYVDDLVNSDVFASKSKEDVSVHDA